MGLQAAGIGIFASSLVRTQVALVLSGWHDCLVASSFWLASLTEPLFSTLFEHIALFNKHMPPFHEGLLSFEHCVYFVSVTLALSDVGYTSPSLEEISNDSQYTFVGCRLRPSIWW